MSRLRTILYSLSIFCAGCASCPSGPASSGRVQAPLFEAKEPTRMTAQVDSFEDLGAFIDFSDNFISYHSVALLVKEPEAIGWKRVKIQFQGIPLLAGRRLELGQRIRFTLPAHDPDGCCAPYLSDIHDAEFVEKQK